MTQLLTLFDVLFSLNIKEKKKKSRTTKIFMTSTHKSSGRTLVLEEEAYTLWAYLLSPDKENVDFEGLVCAVVDPLALPIDLKEISKIKKEIPLPTAYASKYSYVKNLKKKNIKIQWQKESITILIKKKTYLIMDMNTKTSYSKALSKDCDYGKQLKD